MDRYENVIVGLTTHAHKQYCDRVEHMGYKDLTDLCNQQMREKDYSANKDWFIHLGGVWWIYALEADSMTLITCYGRMNVDLPRALRWAGRMNDRIDITHTV